MISQQKYLHLKSQIRKLEKKKEQSIGRLKELQKSLKNEFGCKDLKAAKLLLKKLQAEEIASEKEFNRQYKRCLAELEQPMAEVEAAYPEISDKASASFARTLKGKERNKET